MEDFRGRPQLFLTFARPIAKLKAESLPCTYAQEREVGELRLFKLRVRIARSPNSVEGSSHDVAGHSPCEGFGGLHHPVDRDLGPGSAKAGAESLRLAGRQDAGGGKPKMVGIITERDILRACADRRGSLDDLTVTEYMTHEKELLTGSPSNSVEHIMGIITDHRIRHLPVLEGEELVGIISIGDVVKAQHHQISDGKPLPEELYPELIVCGTAC